MDIRRKHQEFGFRHVRLKMRIKTHVQHSPRQVSRFRIRREPGVIGIHKTVKVM